MSTKRIGIGIRPGAGVGRGVGMGAGSCNACSTRMLLPPGRCCSPPGSFIRVAEQSKLIQRRNLVSFVLRATPNSRRGSRGGGSRSSRIAMEQRRVAEEAFRHVSRGLSAAVADLDDVPCLPPARECCGREYSRLISLTAKDVYVRDQFGVTGPR
ncbi:hypothetical protein NA56DRAFT_203011 [Hyaloscypha hepaticicola]|uniref:Uncharacterized protein n=1 Tax=Hyaloscypha hepaticicola TaxID=2082293 RepID=A0A2J6PZN0_9HELO|nr:hypothetical protein NA56DRAFT_203011 [Hyaloscypha hepaticicola]